MSKTGTSFSLAVNSSPQGSSADFPGDLIAFTAASTRPYPNDPNRLLFSFPVDRPVCRMDESVLITGGTALRAELGRGLVALTQCAIAAGTNAVELLPSRVSRQRFEADLVMDRCTMTSERSVIRLGPWPGSAARAGPSLVDHIAELCLSRRV